MIAFDYNKAVATITDFQKLLLNLQSVNNMCNDEVNECDKAFGDIRHYVELKYPTARKDKTKVCQLIQEYSDRRRKAKDILEVLEPLTDLLNTHKSFLNDVNTCKGKMVKAQAKVNGERHYNPRVLTELFAEVEE